MESKENNVLGLFFTEPTKHWSFKDIINISNTSRTKVNKWLKLFIKDKLIKRIKPRGKMPYYIGNYNCPEYQNKKKIFTLKKLHNSGLLNHLSSLKKAKTIILFGSMLRSDWYSESDLDLFIYGDASEFDLGHYEEEIGHEIQLFTAKSKKDLNKLGPNLMRNIIKGYLVKGDLNFLEVKINA